jgi:tRNA A37 methylthiotransferase MiaB
MRRTEPDIVNISKFFPRPDTESKKMDRVPTETIKERSTRLTRLVHTIGEERNRGWHGWRGTVLINEKGKTSMLGRNYAYKPVVIRDDLRRGEHVEVEIVDSSPTWLLGEPLP